MKMRRNRSGAGLSAALFLAAIPTVSFRSWAQQGNGYYGHMWDGGWHGGFFGPLMMLLLIGLIIVAVVLLVRRGEGQDGSPDQSDETPLDILKKRFARGEIDKDEFEERRRTLGE